jgi:hypothetical protein
MADIPVIGEKPQAIPMDFVGLDLEQVRAFSTLLVMTFSGDMQAIIVPVVHAPTKTPAVQVTIGKGTLPPIVEGSLLPVLSTEEQVIIGRRVVSQNLDFESGLIALAFEEEYALVLTLPDKIEVFKGFEKLGPKVTVN